MGTSKGKIGRQKLTEVEERIFGRDCSAGYMHKQSCEYERVPTILKIELWLTMLSNFEREDDHKD